MTDPRALGLAAHPAGGWFRLTWTSPVVVDTPYGRRPSASAIHFLLDDVFGWHRLRSSELWLWHSGSPVALTTGGTDARPDAGSVTQLAATTPQAVVSMGEWQTARLLGPDPALFTCVASPGFHFGDFEPA